MWIAESVDCESRLVTEWQISSPGSVGHSSFLAHWPSTRSFLITQRSIRTQNGENEFSWLGFSGFLKTGPNSLTYLENRSTSLAPFLTKPTWPKNIYGQVVHICLLYQRPNHWQTKLLLTGKDSLAEALVTSVQWPNNIIDFSITSPSYVLRRTQGCHWN